MFFELLRAPEECTFLEVLAKYEFKRERRRERHAIAATEREAVLLQTEALSASSLSPASAALFSRVVELDARLVKMGQRRLVWKKGANGAPESEEDPLILRFQAMLKTLAMGRGSVRAALGTLSATELLAVETRVLQQARRRYKDAAQQELAQARAKLDVVRSHLLRLFSAESETGRAAFLARVTASAREVILQAQAQQL